MHVEDQKLSGRRKRAFSIRYKIVVLVTLFFVLQTLFLIWVSAATVSKQFRALEDQEAERAVMQAANTLITFSSVVHEKSSDWAKWDDAYEFMADHSAAFIESNLANGSIEGMGIDALIWVKPDGKTIHESTTVPRPHEKFHLDPAEIPLLLADSQKGLTRTDSGFLLISNHLAAFSVRPVVPSSDTAVPRGSLIMIRMMGKTELQAISRALKSDVQFMDLDAFKRLASQDSEGTSEKISRTTWVQRMSDEMIQCRHLMKDFKGTPIGMLVLQHSRHTYWLGIDAMSMMTWSVLGLSCIAGLLLLFGVERIVVTRIMRLLKDIRSVKGDVSGSVSQNGRDEITDIASETNRMLERIRDNRAELQLSQAQLMELNESLERVVMSRTKELAEKTKILENALTGIAVIGPSDQILHANQGFAKVFGADATDIQDRTWRELIFEEFHVGIKRNIVMARLHGRSEMEVQGHRFDGSLFYGQLVFVSEPETTADDPIHCFLRDITTHKELEHHIWNQAFHDSLTGLPNRRLFQERIQEGMVRSNFKHSSLAVFFLDIDNFKVVNDSLGHDVGDKLLIEIASRLKRVVESRGIVARVGGDEFTILMTDLDSEEQALLIADTIIREVSAPMELAGRPFVTTTSVGVAIIDHPTDTEDVLRNADTALYAAKNRGKCQAAIFNSEMHNAVLERLELERDLRIAVEQESFTVLYQPIHSVQSGQIVGVEALVRWNQPANRIVSPSKFIPIAEEIGVVGKIGAQVLRDALHNANRWKHACQNTFKVNVNASVLQIQDPDFPDLIASVLGESGVDPQHLCIEITESVMVSDAEFVIAQLHRIRALGVTIALDDFGSGFSSLSYLRALPVNIVKIDRSFINGVQGSEETFAVIRSLTQLAHDLGMETTGEGVEDPSQLHMLMDVGVTYAQGYLFSRPVSVAEIDEMLFNDLAQAA